MLHELRIYTMYEGRMNAILSRFNERTFGIFDRLGMRVTDFWVDAAGLPKLYYVLAYTDMEERNRLWAQFRQDPEWLEAKRQSEADGPIVEKYEEIFMNRADFFKGDR